ncbi:hypothetical protein B5M09_000987 [Aphanomyces astaci]|uniref:HTH CENPB-type domain-containing protein n=1 Tax=Aphanomyces astaci TaxID=112090 RepID=A0A425D843_APHAT|nr:hypothetical protein B5M09_000987 [Aphanomyces astaci]
MEPPPGEILPTNAVVNAIVREDPYVGEDSFDHGAPGGLSRPQRGNRFGVISPGRPTIFGNRPRQPRQYIKKAYTFREKLDMINYQHLHGTTAALNHFYPLLRGVERRRACFNLNKGERQRALIEEYGYSSRSHLKKARGEGIGTSLSAETELNLVQWVPSMRNEGIPVATIMLQLKAR